MSQISAPRNVAIVLGSADIGSAVAVALHATGFSVVLLDEADPPWHRRGMAFTNAWYIGTAELDGEGACFCASVKSIPSVLARRLIAATTWSWPAVAGALRPTVLVDARGPRRRGFDALLGRVPVTLGIGPGFVEGENVDIAIELPDASAREAVVAGGGLEVDAVPSAPDEGTCTVEAARHGRFMTEGRIGDRVHAGEIVGGLGKDAIAAPATGVLLGLSARGARIEPGDTLVEIDRAGVVHRCYGVAEGPRRIAEVVAAALAARRDASCGVRSRDDAIMTLASTS
jgi:xanthine dehydrogenase accessory factor